jgi:SAM-dependent methyltransferase
MEQTMNERGVGGLDWRTVWRAMYDAERAQGEAATDAEFAQYADHWAPRAARMATLSRAEPQPDAFMQLLLPRLQPGDTVLDIGAGTGRYIPTLSRAVARVIAVEPSPAMRAEMERQIAEHELANVEVVDAFWPPDELPQADVALAAHVVYGVREIAPFLEGITQAARRTCVLYLGIRHPASALAPFWKHVRGEERCELPAAIEALNVLYQLGAAATLELVPIAQHFSYASREEAIDELLHRLRCGDTAERRAQIAAAIDALMLIAADGTLHIRQAQRQAAVISWGEVRSQNSEFRS